MSDLELRELEILAINGGPEAVRTYLVALGRSV